MSRTIARVPADFAKFDYDGEWSEDEGHVFIGERGEDPPAGECWQVWRDQSPISPIFETAEECATWVARTHDCSPVAAAKFVADGWAPSMIGGQFGVYTGVQMAATLADHLDHIAPEGSVRLGTHVRHLSTGVEGAVQFRMPKPNDEYYFIRWDRGLPTLLADGDDPTAPMESGCREDGFEVIPAAES